MGRRNFVEPDPDERLLTIEEATEFLRPASLSAVRLWKRRGILPSYQLGRRVCFKVRDLKAFIEAGRRPARSEAVAVGE